MAERVPQVQTINSLQEQMRSFESLTPKVEPEKGKILTMMLTRLAGHYYRADFTPEQALAKIEDMVADLAPYAMHDVDQAILAYRRDPKAKFFPTSGELRERVELANEQRRSHKRIENSGPVRYEFGDSRPFGWEYHRKRFWKAHWRVSDLDKATDPDRRARYDAWHARVKAGLDPNFPPTDYA